MTLNFFNTSKNPPRTGELSEGDQYRATNTVYCFIQGRPHLPKDFIKALLMLIPGLRKKVDQNNEFENDYLP